MDNPTGGDNPLDLDNDLDCSRGQELVIKTIMPFCDKCPPTEFEFQMLLTENGVKNLSDLDCFDYKDMLKDFLTPVAFGRLRRHLESINTNGTVSHFDF